MLHREKLERAETEKSAAGKSVEMAESSLAKAQEDYKEAVARYEEILGRAKAEATPELITEAYREYAALMTRRGQEMFEVGNYDEVAEIAKSLKELERNYVNIERAQPLVQEKKLPQEMRDELDEISANLDPQGRTRLEKRTSYLLLTHDPDIVLRIVKFELKNPTPRIVARPPWTGWEKRRGIPQN